MNKNEDNAEDWVTVVGACSPYLIVNFLSIFNYLNKEL